MATMSSKQKRYTTLEELEKTERGPVWVLNTTERIEKGGAKMIMSVPKLNGVGNDTVRVPRSFIPFDLTMQVPKAQLLASSEFRSSVGKGHIKLCTPEYAAAILSTEEGKEEARAIENAMRATDIAAQNLGVAELEDEEDQYFDPSKMNINTSKATKKPVKIEGEPNIKFATLVNNAVQENWPQIKVLTAIRNYGKLTKQDIKYAAAKFSSSPKVMKFLQEEMAKLRAAAKA